MNTDILRTIYRTGSLIMCTIVSLGVHPPVLEAGQNNGVTWKNIFVFITGVLSLLLLDKIKNRYSSKTLAFGLVASLIILFAFYEIALNQYSILCPLAQQRVVISNKPVKKELNESLKFWEEQHTGQGLIYLVDANFCSPVKVWNPEDIYPPYYGLITLYLLIIIVFMLLLMVLFDVVKPDSTKPKNKSHEKNKSSATVHS